MQDFWGQKTFCFITGASRGFGKEMAIAFSKYVGAGSTFLLTARSMKGLEAVKNDILSSSGPRPPAVHLLQMDLTKPSREEFIEALTAASGTSHYDHAIIVHNAGIIGAMNQRALEYDDLQEFFDFLSIELASVILFNSAFFSRFKDAEQKSMISITFDGGYKAYRTFGMMCAGKAAKDMFMKTIAIEEKGNIEVICFDPEPIDTDMFEFSLKNTHDAVMVKALADRKASGILLKADYAAEMLVEVLRERKYKNGEYYVCKPYKLLDE